MINSKRRKDCYQMKRRLKDNQKPKILAVASAFGLGPVGKLSTIINATNGKFSWYATGPAFDLKIFDVIPFVEIHFSENEQEIKEFVCRNNIKYALVVLKNKVARYLKSIGLKVLYVDSLPFMWTQTDFNYGKVPIDMDYYCAQKTLDLDKEHLKMFEQVKNLKWIGAVIPKRKEKVNNIKIKPIVINLGGLHWPTGNGMDYIEVIVRPLINIIQEKYKNKIYVTCGDSVRDDVKNYLKNKDVIVCTLTQSNFINLVSNSFLFFTSPGLTTILETSALGVPINLLPAQNLSQFYNEKYVQKYYKKYKLFSWEDEILDLKYLSSLDKLEHEIVQLIYERIKFLKSDKKYLTRLNNRIDSFIDDDYQVGNTRNLQNGTQQIIKLLNTMIFEGENHDN